MLTIDRKRERNPVRTKRAELRYGSQLRKVAEHVGAIVRPFAPGDMSQVPTITNLLDAYSNMLRQWAIQTASNMLMDVALQDRNAWMEHAKDMSRGIREEIRNAPTGSVLQELLEEQVGLIQSIPRDAARRVHRLTLEGLENSTRASEIAKEILRTGEVSASRATLIAVTEVSRTAATLTEARARSINSPGYFWVTSHDSDVRADHKDLDGQFIPWDDPPIADKRSGIRAHAGCIWRCRCWAKVVLPK